MPSKRRFALTAVAIGVLLMAHAVVTWPLEATIALFGGGAILAFVGEAVVIRLGWLEHHIGPKLVGVPLYAPFGLTAVVYASLRTALLVSTGWTAVGVAAVIATTYDILVDHRGVAVSHWEYIDDIPGPRLWEVPWWNYLGWFAISFLTAAVTQPFL